MTHYEILSELGRGGMGVVYRARDVKLGRVVALKSPLPRQPEDRDHRRFFREARAAARLSHPHIVPIFEVFEDERGTPWIAMEFVDGSSLKALISEGKRLPLDDVLRHAQGLAEALHCAHSHHVLHRDVTPRNILVTADGRAQLTDFGLAHSFLPASDSSSDATASWSGPGDLPVGGTPGYMSPEQVLGGAQDVRSDLFSFGVVLYEMCTGTRAFPAVDRATLADAILHHEPVPILRQNHDVPPELERIVAKAMAKRADERYQSAQDLMADLKALRRQVDSGVSQEDYVQVRRQRVWLAVVAGLVVLGIGVAALILAQRWLAPALPRSVPHQLTSAPGWEAQPALSPDGSLIAYASDEAGQPDIWLVDAHGGSTLRLTDGSAAARSPAWFPSGEAVAFVSDREGRTGIWKVSRLGGIATRLEADAEDPAISPDDTRIAFARSGPSGEMRIFVAPLSNVEDARMLTSDGAGLWNHRYPGWSPDGRTLCYSGQRDLWAVSATGGPARKLTSDDEVDTECAWSPSGRYVYFSSYREGTMAVWRVTASGGPAERVTLGGGPEVHPSLSRDGRRLAYSTFLENPDVVIHDLGTGKESRIGGLREEFSPVFCPDARAVAFVSNRLGGRFDLWWQAITPDGQPGPPRRLTDHAGSATRPTCSPDGRWVAYHRVLAGQRDIWVVPAEGGNSMQFTTDPAADVHPDWSPDGSRLAFASERGGGSHIWVQPIAGGRPAGSARAVTSGDRMDLAPAWSPDGRAIAFIGSSAGDPGSVWIVRVDEGAPARRVTVGAGAVRVRWERSSGLLLVSGHWGAPEIGIRRVNPEDGRSSEPLPAIRIAEGLVDFDVSPDGRLITFSRAEHRGDIWLLEAQAGSY